MSKFHICYATIKWILNSRNELFTKQSAESHFSDDLRKFTNTITDIGSKIDIVREGGNLLY